MQFVSLLFSATISYALATPIILDDENPNLRLSDLDLEFPNAQDPIISNGYDPSCGSASSDTGSDLTRRNFMTTDSDTTQLDATAWNEDSSSIDDSRIALVGDNPPLRHGSACPVTPGKPALHGNPTAQETPRNWAEDFCPGWPAAACCLRGSEKSGPVPENRKRDEKSIIAGLNVRQTSSKPYPDGAELFDHDLCVACTMFPLPRLCTSSMTEEMLLLTIR